MRRPTPTIFDPIVQADGRPTEAFHAFLVGETGGGFTLETRLTSTEDRLDTAEPLITTAQTTADSAATAAATAQTTADDAQTAASAAQTSADDAQTDATQALADAAAAQTDATQAIADAAAAQTTANNALPKAGGTITGPLLLSALATHADNTAATGAGLAVNTVYKTATGELRIVV